MPKKPDMSCVPYSRKRAYWFLTIPFLFLLLITFIYLWTINVGSALIFIALFILACLFQSYCCTYQDCPYIGGWCPAISGIIPASLFAKMFCGKNIEKTKMRFALFGTVAFCSLAGLGVFPLYWLGQRSTMLAVTYV